MEALAKDHLNTVVNIGWPFGIEAKIIAVMDAEKTYRAPNDQMISMETEFFQAKLAALKEMLDDFLIIYLRKKNSKNIVRKTSKNFRFANSILKKNCISSKNVFDKKNVHEHSFEHFLFKDILIIFSKSKWS